MIAQVEDAWINREKLKEMKTFFNDFNEVAGLELSPGCGHQVPLKNPEKNFLKFFFPILQHQLKQGNIIVGHPVPDVHRNKGRNTAKIFVGL